MPSWDCRIWLFPFSMPDLSPAAALSGRGAAAVGGGQPDLFPAGHRSFPLPGAVPGGPAPGRLVPAAANGANERAVALFLEGKIGFLDIPGWWKPP